MAAVLKDAAVPHAGTIAEQLAGFVDALEFDRIPPAVRERAKHLILDAIGCAFAAGRFEFAPRSVAAIADLAGSGDSVVIGYRQRLPMRDAVLANGILAHGLDYDDTHTAGVLHATVSVLPCVLGVAADRDRSGRELLTAFIAGVEAAARLGAVVKGGLHRVGFHPTGVVGAFACALAAGKLYGLAAEQLVLAQGVALSVAGGSLEFLEDGSWTKRFHPGWAAVGGITAAALARHGFPAPRAAYEGRFGFYNIHLGPLAKDCDYTLATAGLGSVWETTQVAVKPFPLCHFTHACADAAIALRRQGVNPADIVAVRALVPDGVVAVVCEPVASKRRPQNDYDAKFSIPFVVAASLIRGRFSLAELDDASLRDPQILALADRVAYEIDRGSDFPQHYTGEVIVRLADGRELRHREAVNRGAADRPIVNADVVAKFMENASLVMSAARARAVCDAVLALDGAASARTFAAVLAR